MPILDSLVEIFKGSGSSSTTPRSAADATQSNDESDDTLVETTHEETSGDAMDVMDSPLRYGDGKRQYCLVEMRRESETGNHLDTFVTLAMADKATNIPRQDIGKACFAGGALVNGRYFRFVDERGQKVPDDVLAALNDAMKGTSIATTQKPTSGGEKTRDETAIDETNEKPASSKASAAGKKRPRDEADDTSALDSAPMITTKESLSTTGDETMIGVNEGLGKHSVSGKKRRSSDETDTDTTLLDSAPNNANEDAPSTTPVVANAPTMDSVSLPFVDTAASATLNSALETEQAVSVDGRDCANYKISHVADEQGKKPNDTSPASDGEKHAAPTADVMETTMTNEAPDGYLDAGLTGKKRSRDESISSDAPSQESAEQQKQPPSVAARETSAERPAASEESGPPAPYTFDVSTLLPVTRKNQKALVRPPKVIELIDKGANEVVVCFSGVTHAHRALGLDRGFTTMACLNYGTPVQPDLGGYILRYAAYQEGPLAAYEYGAHKEDWKQINETHQARLARWKKVMLEERTGQRSSPIHKKKTALAEPRKPKAKKKSAEPRKKSERSKAADESMQTTAMACYTGMTRFRGDGTVDAPVKLVDVSVPTRTSIVNDTDTSRICIMCQESGANVVLEPCHHCVLCVSCAETSCRTFCPCCRTTITDRLQTTSILVVRPRIYSSYSFM